MKKSILFALLAVVLAGCNAENRAIGVWSDLCDEYPEDALHLVIKKGGIAMIEIEDFAGVGKWSISGQEINILFDFIDECEHHSLRVYFSFSGTIDRRGNRINGVSTAFLACPSVDVVVDSFQSEYVTLQRVN